MTVKQNTCQTAHNKRYVSLSFGNREEERERKRKKFYTREKKTMRVCFVSIIRLLLQIRINFPGIPNISARLFNVLFTTFRCCRFHWTSALCFRVSFNSAHTRNAIWSIPRPLFTFPFNERWEIKRKGERACLWATVWDFGRVFCYLDGVLIGIFFWHQ